MNENPAFPYEEEISHIRQKPGIYFGSRGVRGIEQFVYELVANVLDSYLANQATFLNVELVNLKLGETIISVTDDANGLASLILIHVIMHNPDFAVSIKT